MSQLLQKQLIMMKTNDDGTFCTSYYFIEKPQNNVSCSYRVCQGFWTNLIWLNLFGLVLGLSQFSIPPQLPRKINFASKVVKSGSKTIISICQSKSVTHSVAGKYMIRNINKKRKLFPYLQTEIGAREPYFNH